MMMARKEVKLTSNGVKLMNKQLAVFFTSRSLEAIKKLRQRGNYKEKIEQIRGQSALVPEVASLTAGTAASEWERRQQYAVVNLRKTDESVMLNREYMEPYCPRQGGATVNISG